MIQFQYMKSFYLEIIIGDNMEDYDVFNEMQNIKDKRTIIIIEDDENFIIQNLLDSSF